MTSIRYHRLVGLQVVDEEGYARYRSGMTPILERYGGRFVQDFRVSEVLRSSAEHPINRVFVLSFPDEARHDAFFADPAYLEVRRAHFGPAVEGATTLARYPATDAP